MTTHKTISGLARAMGLPVDEDRDKTVAEWLRHDLHDDAVDRQSAAHTETAGGDDSAKPADAKIASGQPDAGTSGAF
ncbi:hypothetical protein [Hyphobacterium sp.]|uniref:hypothetical protein n=1 Tax=Hyphobacterium sp. TaxID=2004662 RepID=UPI003B52E8CF